jgi:hypothetical protein
MKAVLEFDLGDVENDDEMKFKMAVNASNYYWALYDFKNAKKSIEWELDNKEMDKYEAMDKIFNEFWSIIENHGVNFEF